LQPQIKALSAWLIDVAASAGMQLLVFIFAFVIAGILLAHSVSSVHLARSISK
jgi:hypothetical protein